MSAALVLSLVFVGLLVLWVWETRQRRYWRRRGVPGPAPVPLFGNYAPYILQRRYWGQAAQDICRAFPNAPYVGAYFGPDPALILQDPAIVKLVMAQAFTHFHGREITSHTDRETITKNLFFAHGDRWKLVRQGMSPAFTSAKLKGGFYLIENCAKLLQQMLEREVRANQIIEVRSLSARYSMDAICTFGFGINVNTQTEDVSNNAFKKIGELIFKSSFIRGFLLASRSAWPSIFYGLGLYAFPKSIEQFFDTLLTEVFEGRSYKPSGRQDFVDMMLKIKEEDYVTSESIEEPGKVIKLKIDKEYLTAQCTVFFAAGFETTSATLAFALYELAKDPESQDRAIEEVDDYLRKNDGKIHFECVTELPYLDAVLNEAIRLYPVLGVLTREVMHDYTLPDGLKLERGLRIHIPVYHLHHNPAFFPEPERFRPDRFLPENRHLIQPFTYIPFGEGPRICIGMRSAKMQMLPGLLTVLRNYRVELAPGTPKILRLDPRVIATQTMDTIKLKFVKRELSN